MRTRAVLGHSVCQVSWFALQCASKLHDAEQQDNSKRCQPLGTRFSGSRGCQLQLTLLTEFMPGHIIQRSQSGPKLSRLITRHIRSRKSSLSDSMFRDPFCRQRFLPTEIPPLRERCEDILLHFRVSRLPRRMQKRIRSVPKHAMEALVNAD